MAILTILIGRMRRSFNLIGVLLLAGDFSSAITPQQIEARDREEVCGILFQPINQLGSLQVVEHCPHRKCFLDSLESKLTGKAFASSCVMLETYCFLVPLATVFVRTSVF